MNQATIDAICHPVWRVSTVLQKAFHVNKYVVAIGAYAAFISMHAFGGIFALSIAVATWIVVDELISGFLSYIWQKSKSDEPDPSGAIPFLHVTMFLSACVSGAVFLLILPIEAFVYIKGGMPWLLLPVAGRFLRSLALIAAIGPGVPPEERWRIRTHVPVET